MTLIAFSVLSHRFFRTTHEYFPRHFSALASLETKSARGKGFNASTSTLFKYILDAKKQMISN